MTVGINPVQRGGGDDLGAIFKAIDIATSLYGAKLNREQADLLNKQKQATEAAKLSAEDLERQRKDQEKLVENQKEDEKFIADMGSKFKPGPGGIKIPRLAGGFNLPTDTTFVPVKPPATPKDPKATEAEKTTALYGKRMEQSNSILEKLESDPNFDISSMGSSIQRMSLFPQRLKSDNIKKYEQAQRNFVNAVLRKESGAVISPEEFENAVKQYFPQDDDNAELIAQKQENRLLAIEAMKTGSGNYWDKVQTPTVVAKTRPEAGTATAAPMEDTKLINGVPYKKVQGGWQRIK